MDFPQIQTNQIMNDIQAAPINNSTGFRLVTGGNLLDKPTFGEKFMMGLKKFGSIFCKIGGKIASFFPGWGTIASAALYGVGDMSEKAYQKQVGDRMNNLALDEQAANSSFGMITPGFGQFGTPPGAAQPGVAPAPSDGLEMQKLDTVIMREGAAQQQINTASFS